MIAYIVKNKIKTKVQYLTYDEGFGVSGSFIDSSGLTQSDDIYDILIINGYDSKLIESCVNTVSDGNKVNFKAVRVRDL